MTDSICTASRQSRGSRRRSASRKSTPESARLQPSFLPRNKCSTMTDSICTGSHLHRRSFPEDDYWPSFQSTIISGQVMSAEETTNTAATSCNAAEMITLATIGEQAASAADLSSFVEDEAREDPWNMNIDAIGSPELPDDDFYDCPSFEKSPANLRKPSSRVLSVVYSPRPYSQPQFYTVQFASPPDDNGNNSERKSNDLLASPRKRSATAKRISPRLVITHASDASSSGAGIKTGSYLVQMIDDFKDLEDHAQSTPKLSSDSGNPSSGNTSIFVSEVSHVDQLRKNLDSEFQNAETVVVSSPPKTPQEAEVSASNKENFYDGKYSSFVAMRRALEKKPSPKKLHTRAGKVALLKEYFQARVNDSIQLHKSRIPVPVRGRVKKSPQAKTRAHGSPSYLCHKSYKLVSSRASSGSRISQPSTATTFSSSGSDSFLTRNLHKSSRTSRVQSCSDATNAELASIEETCKSQSTGDLPSNCSASIKVLNSSKITKRAYLNVQEPSQASVLQSPKKVSAINKRRSVGLQLKKNASPVKPVCELRKLFTPSKRARRNSGSQCSFNVTRKQTSHLVVPKILISHL